MKKQTNKKKGKGKKKKKKEKKREIRRLIHLFRLSSTFFG